MNLAVSGNDNRWNLRDGGEIAPGRSAVRLLGGGPRHEVYLAWDERLLSLVVAKLLRPDCLDSPRARDELVRESSALTKLNHPVLPRCFGVSLDSERPHLVMEFLDGPRLSTVLRRHGPLMSEQLIPLALQMCAVLHYLAGEGTVHLDVKPKNIIMGPVPRLVDFNISRSLKEAAGLSSPLGTDTYMAPEQCGVAGRGVIGPAADVWGLGVTLYEAVSAQLPFPRAEGARPADPLQRFPQLDSSSAPLPATVPFELRRAIESCLNKHPEERPAAAEVAEQLEPLVEALPRPLLTPKLRPRPWRSVRRR